MHVRAVQSPPLPLPTADVITAAWRQIATSAASFQTTSYLVKLNQFYLSLLVVLK